jgi:peptidoglycan L-alanyl-D-glutamate endopeptidase CwlK
MTPRDTARLVGVHPSLVERVARVLDAMAALGHPMLVVDGRRTADQQASLYAKGRTKPGAIVTHADGVRMRSNHQAHTDGFGYAVDLAFLVDGRASWDIAQPWQAFGACAEALGLTWGGRWTRLADLPHVELPKGA